MPSADSERKEADGRIALFGLLPAENVLVTPRSPRAGAAGKSTAESVDDADQIGLFTTYGEPEVGDLEGLLLGPAQVVSRSAPLEAAPPKAEGQSTSDTRSAAASARRVQADKNSRNNRNTATDDDSRMSRAARSVRDPENTQTARGRTSRAGARTTPTPTREARLSVVVDEPWRASALVSAFGLRGLPAEPAPNPTGDGTTVRSRFGPELASIARRWTRGSRKRIPDGFGMTPAHLRLWAIAAGRSDSNGYLFHLGGSDEQLWEPVGALFTAAGLTSRFVGVRGGGPAYRISGRRAYRRLAELLGEPPPAAPRNAWPL